MTVDSWQPTPTPQAISAEDLKRLLICASDFQTHKNFTPEFDWIQPFAQVDASIWQNAVENLNDEQLIEVIKLLTSLETSKNWDLAEKSPVIAVFKAYKKKSGVNRELVKWVKTHSDNQYLPFGPLL